MNIFTNEAGSVTHAHIIESGFTVFDTIEGNDMGQMNYSLPQYTNGQLKIVGGYWKYVVQDDNGKELWSGWWNSNDEFDKTIADIK